MICVGRTLLLGPVGIDLVGSPVDADEALATRDAAVALTSSTVGFDSTGGGGPLAAGACWEFIEPVKVDRVPLFIFSEVGSRLSEPCCVGRVASCCVVAVFAGWTRLKDPGTGTL